MLRDHGPSDPGFLLVMLVLATYMDRHGFAFPGQPTWAKAARKSVRMLQRYIARGRRLGWLEVINAGRSGKGWAFNGYRCCIPDGIELDAKDEEIATAIVAEAGDIDGDDTMMSQPGAVGNDIAMSSPSGNPVPFGLRNGCNNPIKTQSVAGAASPVDSIQRLAPVEHGGSTVQAPSGVLRSDGDDMASTMVTTSGALGDDKSSNLVATQLWRTNSRSENSRSITHTKSEGRLSTTDSSRGISTTSEPDETAKAKAAAEAEARAKKRVASINRLLDVGNDPTEVARMLKQSGVSLEDVQLEVRSRSAGGGGGYPRCAPADLATVWGNHTQRRDLENREIFD